MPFIETTLGRWFYADEGAPRGADSEAIVLLHGFLFDHRMWRAQIAPLAEHGRVIAFDAPGHGSSDDPPPFTLEDQSVATLIALRRMGIERAIVGGLSWGAMVALRMALAEPSRVAALALFGATAELESRASVAFFRMFAPIGRRIGLPSAFVRATLAPLIYAPSTLRREPHLIDELCVRAAGRSKGALARVSKAIVARTSDLSPHVHRLSMPALLVAGRDDRTIPPQKSQRLAARMPNATVHVLASCGHVAVQDAPAEVNAKLIPFVAQHLR